MRTFNYQNQGQLRIVASLKDTEILTHLNASYDKVLATILSIVGRLSKNRMALSEATRLQVDVGLSSLQVMELVLEIEDEFDISFPLNRLPDIHTVKDLSLEIVAVLEH